LIVERERGGCLLLVPQRVPDHSTLLTRLCHVGCALTTLGVRPDVLFVITDVRHAMSVAESVIEGTTPQSS